MSASLLYILPLYLLEGYLVENVLVILLIISVVMIFCDVFYCPLYPTWCLGGEFNLIESIPVPYILKCVSQRQNLAAV